MILAQRLKELNMDEADIAEIRAKDAQYGSYIAPLAQCYMNSEEGVLNSFADQNLKKAKEVALSWLSKARQLAQTEEEDYMLQLLFWLHCIPYLEREYQHRGIGKDVLINSLMDLTYKTRECRKKFGCCGITTQRYYLFFCMGMFGLGRLQFQPTVYDKNVYRFGDYTLNPGDRIYGCHIPSAGKLTPELCMDSLDRAYNFFKEALRGDILPVRCSSWLLYPPYEEHVFPAGSNMQAFARMFDILSSTGFPEDLYIMQTVFGVPGMADPDSLPQETALQRNLAAYLKSGGTFGSAYGILLYDGAKKEILNKR